MASVFDMNRGSTLNFQFNWPAGPAGGNANLTGFVISSYDIHTSLTGAISLVIEDEPAGLIMGSIAWREEIPEGKGAYFRIRLKSPSGDNVTSNRLFLNTK